MRYMHMPYLKITLGSTVFINEKDLDAQVTRIENGFDTATIILNDAFSYLYPDIVTVGTAVQIDIKDAVEGNYPTNPLFKGIVRFPVLQTDSSGEKVILKCDGSGYGLAETVVAQEYGDSSSLGAATDRVSEILTDASNGIVTKWVNKIMESATDSGFSYSTDISVSLTDNIDYICYPYKPCNKAIDDLCDLVTAIRTYSSNYGPHWIVTTDDCLRMKTLDEDRNNWHEYYNASTAGDEAKLYQGSDFFDFNFEKIGPEANYVVYNGMWRKPSNGDSWTETSVSMWGETGAPFPIACASSNTYYKIGSYSLKLTPNGGGTTGTVYTPTTQDLAIDFTMASNIPEVLPRINFYALRSAGLTAAYIVLNNDGANSWYYDFLADLVATNTWYHFSLPIGPNYHTEDKSKAFDWTILLGAPVWTNINYAQFYVGLPVGEYMYVDGFHFSGIPVLRVARRPLATITTQKLKVKVITDDVGKDDTLKSGTPGTTDIGLMARMAQAELYRLSTTSLVGTVTVPMIKDLLPGQKMVIYAKKTSAGSYNINGVDMRVTRIVHNMNANSFTSTLSLTDDVTNSHPRSRYEDWNTVLTHSARPEFQDRQSTSMKIGELDIRLTRLEEEY